MYRRLTTLAIPLALLIGACGDDAEPEPRLLFTQTDASASDCPNGGIVVSSGLDVNNDAVLDEDEITDTEILCEGDPGDPGDPGFDALVRTTVEPPGADCAEGGLRIDSGFDENRNGTLDDGEIDQTTFVCDQPAGEDGRDYLVRTSSISPGGACDTAAGILVESGLDDDFDDVLDDEEVDDTQTVCAGRDGFDVRVEIEAEAAGNNCSGGGQRVERGRDLNRDGALQANEIDEVTFICDPLRSLVVTSSVAPGPECANGGTRIERGVDTNANDLLDATEIEETIFACDGVNGLPNLVITSTVGPGADCANGGVRIESGLDDNRDNELQVAEIDATTFACDADDGADGRGGSAVRIADEPAGTNCANGGTRIETGPDTDGDGQLDDDEVNSTRYLCDGSATTTLVNIVEESAGANCLNGGQRVDSGVDTNGDGILQAAEVASTTYVCSPTNTVPLEIITAMDLGSELKTVPFTATIEAVGGLGGYTWTVAPGDQLPPGFSLDTTGTPDTDISGAGTSTGTFTFDVIVNDFVGSVDVATFQITIDPLPCEPGVDGLPGLSPTAVATPIDIDSSSYAIEADDDASGYVYINGTGSGEFVRYAKDGSSSDDIETLAGATAGSLTGYVVKFEGDDVYAIPSAATGTVGRVTRISTDGGTTYALQDMLDFTTVGEPSDVRGVAVDGNTMYVISHEDDCILYEADISGTLPAAASITFNLTGFNDCSGLAVDDSYVYTTAGGIPRDSIEDAVIRIDRVTGTTDELFADFFVFNLDDSGYNDIAIQDGDGDGTTDVLWAAGDGGDRRYICTPASVSTDFFSQPFGITDGDNGLALDTALNALWLYDETGDELLRLE